MEQQFTTTPEIGVWVAAMGLPKVERNRSKLSAEFCSMFVCQAKTPGEAFNAIRPTIEQFVAEGGRKVGWLTKPECTWRDDLPLVNKDGDEVRPGWACYARVQDLEREAD